MDRRSAMATTLTALRARRNEVATELAQLEQRVAALSAEDGDLQAATDALQRLLGEDVGPALEEGDRDIPPFIPGEVITRDEPPRRKKVRSTQMVKDHLMVVARPETRDEILAYFEAEGIAANWKNPENALNSALLRAVASGEVRELDDGRVVHVSAPTIDSPSSPVSGAPTHTEEQ